MHSCIIYVTKLIGKKAVSATKYPYTTGRPSCSATLDKTSGLFLFLRRWNRWEPSTNWGSVKTTPTACFHFIQIQNLTCSSNQESALNASDPGKSWWGLPGNAEQGAAFYRSPLVVLENYHSNQEGMEKRIFSISQSAWGNSPNFYRCCLRFKVNF